MTTAPVAALGERMKTGRILHREYCIDLERNRLQLANRLHYPPTGKVVPPGTSFLLPGPSDRRGMREGGYRQPSKRRSHGLAARQFASAGPWTGCSGPVVRTSAVPPPSKGTAHDRMQRPRSSGSAFIWKAPNLGSIMCARKTRCGSKQVVQTRGKFLGSSCLYG